MDVNALLKEALKAVNEDTERRSWKGKFPGSDTEVELFATAISPFDSKTVGRKFPGFELSPTSAAMVYMICHKATDANGKKFFAVVRDFPLMERLPSEFTAPIAEALFGDDFEDGDLSVENLTKN